MADYIFKKGDVVVARDVIVDRHDGDFYIHSPKGGLGVVNDYGQVHPAVDVTWADGSQCTLLASEIDLYTGNPIYVVDRED